jgi:hypothetical protein
MSFPPATEMFQFAGFASRTYGLSTGYRQSRPWRWVAPFGDPGIADRSHLPRAFRSVPRPSSPLSAKASTRCPYSALERHTQRQGPCRYPNRASAIGTIVAANASQKTHPRDPARRLTAARVSRYGHTTRFFTIVHQQMPSPPLAGMRQRHTLLHAAVVEVNGLEPSTSCLQSRRSPS